MTNSMFTPFSNGGRFARMLFIGITGLFLILVVLASLADAMSPATPEWIRFVLWVTTGMSSVLALINLFLVILVQRHRRAHALLLLCFLAVMLFSQSTIPWHRKTRQAWFIQNEIPALELRANELIARHRAGLVAPDPKRDWIFYGGGVSSLALADGSIIVRFQGRDGSLRHGYMYYSSGQLLTNPVDSSGYFAHITNGWHEY